MRLYRIMGHAWAGTQADAKAAAKEHGKPFHETEVPTDKPGLLAWLNERNVAARLEELAELAKPPLARDPMDELEPIAGAVLTEAEVARVNASRPNFLPRLDAAEIERRRMALDRCPKCNSAAAIEIGVDQVLAWIHTAEAEQLERVAAAVKDEAAELGEQGRAN